MTRGDTRCLLCGQIVKGKDVRRLAAEGKMGSILTAVILETTGSPGKHYRMDVPHDMAAYTSAANQLEILRESYLGDTPLIPDEPIDSKTLGLRVDSFGLNEWGKLFNARQLLALITFARLVAEAHDAMIKAGLDAEYAKSVETYLGLLVDRLASQQSTLSRWHPQNEQQLGAFARQALPMVWDFPEAVPIGAGGGSWQSLLSGQLDFLDSAAVSNLAPSVKQLDATSLDSVAQVIVTDPPYYNAIDYAGLSDFFYVWLKRSIGVLYPDLLSMPLTPKKQQAIMASETVNTVEHQRYVSMLGEAFSAMRRSLVSEGLLGVVFAHSDPDAWATLIEGLLGAELIPQASWPIDTEMQIKISSASRANLKTSVWLACRKREGEATEAFLSDVMEKMRSVVRERLLYFWSKGIRGADFFISAIGPALSVFGRHTRVLRPDGEAVSVRDFLDIVRRESTAVALEQVLQGADLGQVDPITRQYVTWVWSYSRAPLDTGEAIALCLATGAAYDEMTRPHSIAAEMREKSRKMARLRTIRQRAMDDEDLGNGSAARPTPLIDQLQHAAWLWGQNLTDRLAVYRGQLGETRWSAMRTLGQAVAECLPDGDEDRRIILGLLGSNVMATAARPNGDKPQARLPGIDDNAEK